MRNKIFFISILFFFITSYQKLFADSPLTSTEISKAYKDLAIIEIASGSEGKLIFELLAYLDGNNPLDVKIALINELSWDFKGKNNSIIFFDYLKSKYNYKNENDFLERANSSQLICMAYLKAMDNYFDVAEAKLYAQKAKVKNKKSYTVNIICALIEAQESFDSNDWCDVFKKADNVRLNKSLTMDMKKNAVNTIFEYMDLYKKYCVELNDNSDYVQEEYIESSNSLFIGNKSYPSSDTYSLNSGDFIKEKEIQICFAKDADKGIIAFAVNNSFMPTTRVKNKLILYLDNNEVITCVDRGKFDIVDDYATTLYYLTKEEINKLKKSNISTIRYTVGDNYGLDKSYSVTNRDVERIDFSSIIEGLFN